MKGMWKSSNFSRNTSTYCTSEFITVLYTEQDLTKNVTISNVLLSIILFILYFFLNKQAYSSQKSSFCSIIYILFIARAKIAHFFFFFVPSVSFLLIQGSFLVKQIINHVRVGYMST